ncbi:alginate lyase [Pedobacter yulinensis]|uniref:Alginate lyase n=1 Tax=Pedobacter yulinensis TaxID=2126353 RepID=A0A2T3HR96_9SPHI|nr:alginate lyase family protein [Pedobacter yulinensis]PST84985.1 alginate lyase [Pedobacter yulinensis]
MKILIAIGFLVCLAPKQLHKDSLSARTREMLRSRVIREAKAALRLEPVTITAYPASRSTGTRHDFYSEGDYWWPDPANLQGPYIQRDGLSNPANFVAHRQVLIRFSKLTGALASAYLLTGEERYAVQALRHLKAWLVEPATLMNPSLAYAQAVKGRFTGRGIGIIDTIHLMEVARAIMVFGGSTLFQKEMGALTGWFERYLHWLNTHPYSKDEMNAKNNHGTCWVMQVACFSRLTGNKPLLDLCRQRFREILLPGQMAADGSFPLEIKRTKPYGYSIFNLDAMVMCCLLLSDGENDLWNYALPDGRNIRRALNFLEPYLRNKNSWPYPRDVMYWDEWPVASPGLLFSAIKFENKSWFDTWSGLNHQPANDEIIRNLPVRNPLLWLDLVNP